MRISTIRSRSRCQVHYSTGLAAGSFKTCPMKTDGIAETFSKLIFVEVFVQHKRNKILEDLKTVSIHAPVAGDDFIELFKDVPPMAPR